MVLVLPDGRRLAVEKSVLSIGADPACDVVLAHAEVRPSHALLLREGDGLTVLQSPAGGRIRVNGRKVESAALQPGDVLTLGQAQLRLEAATPKPAPPPSDGKVLGHLASFASRLLARRPARELLEQVLWGMVEATSADSGSLVVEEAGVRRVLVGSGASPQVAVADTLVDRVFASGAPLLVEDVASHPKLGAAPSMASLQLASAIAVPLHAPRAPAAVIYLGRRPGAAPFGPGDLEAAVALASLAALLLGTSEELLALCTEVGGLTGRLRAATFEGLVGESPPMRALYRRLERLGPTSLNVLIRGETGTGKELVARALHRLSGRRGRLVALSCAALPAALAERELFGHARGTFSGATCDRPGLFEAADGGTLFLDELAEMPPVLQVKLLRAVQEREVTRLGETRPRKVEVRLLCATHQDLERAVADGAFRADLMFRLNEVDVQVPPLRERGEDVLLIAHHVLRVEGARAQGFTHRALEVLRGHPFPGNVRQLVSTVRRAALLGQGALLDPAALGLEDEAWPLAPLEQARDEFVRRHVREAIARAGGNKRRAAEALGIGVRSIFRHLGEEEE